MRPRVGLKLQLGAGEVARRRGKLNLVARYASVANADEEAALNAHDGGYELVQRARIDEGFHRYLLHARHAAYVGPRINLKIVVHDVGNDVDERAGLEHIVVVLLRCNHLYVACPHGNGQHEDL